MGTRSTLRTALATWQAFISGGGMVATPCVALLHESAATLNTGGRKSIMTITATAQAIHAATTPMQDLAYRSSMEAICLLGLLGSQSRATMRAFKEGSKVSFSIISEWPVRSGNEVKGAAGKDVLKAAKRFDHHMSHEVYRSLNVHLFYPIEKGIYPKIQRIYAIWHQINKRIDAILHNL